MSTEIKTEKKPWRKPELTVLLRTRPEVTVLAGCKNLNEGDSASRTQDHCGFGGGCTPCVDTSSS
jgi:hypothetical protein